MANLLKELFLKKSHPSSAAVTTLAQYHFIYQVPGPSLLGDHLFLILGEICPAPYSKIPPHTHFPLQKGRVRE